MILDKKNTSDFVEYLKNEALSGTNIAVKFDYNEIQYILYFQGESLVYATNSILPNERLERHLKYLSYNITRLKGIWQKINQELEENPHHEKDNDLPPEYNKFIWLAEKKYLNPQQLNILGKRLSQEILESLLLIETIDSQTVNISEHNLTNVFQHNFTQVLEETEKKLEKWQTLVPEIQSTYQRPYLGIFDKNENNNKTLSQADKEKLARILRGFNFRQLGALLNQDELLIAQRLYPLIKRKIIILRNPKPEFEQKMENKLSEKFSQKNQT